MCQSNLKLKKYTTHFKAQMKRNIEVILFLWSNFQLTAFFVKKINCYARISDWGQTKH